MYNLPITLKEQDTIYGTFLCTKFIELYEEDLNNTISKLQELVTTEESQKILDIIINVVNKYSFIDNKLEVKDLIIYDLQNTKVPHKDNATSIHETDLDRAFTKDDQVFLLSFNQGIIPTIYKDEEYLTDNDKQELNISYTVDKNNNAKENTINIIKQIPNLTITYKKTNNGEENLISNLNENLKYQVNTPEVTYNYSNLYNHLKLTSLLDEYYKYGTKSELLESLNNTYPLLPYNTYDNKYTQINDSLLKDFLNHKLKLSYTRLNSYFSCPFSYYISSVLKLNKDERNFANEVGNIFHAVLEKRTKDSNLDLLWDDEVKNSTYEFNIEEKYLLRKLKKELEFIVDTIDHQETFTNLHDELHEQSIYVNINNVPDMNTIFNGKIDKIKYKEYDDKTILSIIDYKTGNTEIELNMIPYGLSMQLPVYLYLIKHYNKFRNPQIAGFYLQKILDKEIQLDGKHTYEQLKRKKLLLHGYSNNNVDILKEFDLSYMDSNIIQSMKMTQKGEFYHYTKTLTNKEMDILSDMIEKKIEEGAKSISEASFEIAPKVVGDKNGCAFCTFKDICFRTNKDINELPELKTEDILGGDTNELH